MQRSPRPGADGSRLGKPLAEFFAREMPSAVAVALPTSGLFQLAGGAQVIVKHRGDRSTQKVLALLPRAHAYMQRGKHDQVDGVVRYFAPLRETSTAALYGVFSDSTLVLGGDLNARQAVISRVRAKGDSVRVVVRGGFRIRDIAKEIAEKTDTHYRVYERLVVIYQIND